MQIIQADLELPTDGNISQKRKIQAAKMLLAETQKTVDQIAEETGFCDSSYFCKIFKRFESITPSQFRSIEQAL